MIDVLTFPVVKLWVSMALLTLAMLCYTDIKNRKVDKTRNSVMSGAGIMATLPLGLGTLYIIHLFVAIVFNAFYKKLNKRFSTTFFALGDQSVLIWLLPGLVLFSIYAPVVFLVVMAMVLISIGVIQKKFNNILGEKLPGVVIMALSFLITIGIFL